MLFGLFTLGLFGLAPMVKSATAKDKDKAAASVKQARKATQKKPIHYSTLRKQSIHRRKAVNSAAQMKRKVSQLALSRDKKVVHTISRSGEAYRSYGRLPSRHVNWASRGRLASRGYFSGRNTLVMIATAYDPGPACNGGSRTGRTATGLKAGYGVVAVDPRVIPLGTHLYIEGYGRAVAADVGSAIKGDRIDLCFGTRHQADEFGRRKVIVHILD